MKNRFFWSARPAQALLEVWLLGLVIFLVLSQQVGIVSPFVLTNGVLFLCGACGLWAVLRTCLPQGTWLRRVLWELAVGLALSLVMAVGLFVPARFLGWEGVWLQSTLKNAGTTTLLLGGTGLGYVVARLGVRLWFVWDRMRRRRMLWAMTHAFLSLVVVLSCLGALGMFLLSPYSSAETLVQPDMAGMLTSIAERLLHTVFPGMSLVMFITALLLLVLLPPSAMFSYWVARKTTRRLETLVAASKSLREGHYDARVPVVGEDEVAQLQADFNAMAAELEQSMRDLEAERDKVAALLQAQRELVAGVSHELRTPVATVRSLLEFSRARRAEELPGVLARDLQTIEAEVVRLQGLIDDLFTLSRAEAGGLPLEMRPVDVGIVIRRRVEAMAPLAWQSSRVEVTTESPPDLPLVLADEARLEQILINLLRNALRHTTPGGIVAVMAAEEADAVVIEVRDTGEGIAPENLPRIWERFYRGQGSGGAGLGLALVKELAEAMGGSVSVESEVGKGSCFTVSLPRSRP